MKLSWGAVGILVFAIAIGGHFYYWFVPTEIRYRLTVVVDNAGETVTASSVIAAYYYPHRTGGNSSGASGGGRRSYARGVAPIIDLGSKGTLIADISRAWGATSLPIAACMELPSPSCDMKTQNVETVRWRGPKVLTPKRHPFFIWIPPSGDSTAARQFRSYALPSTFLPDVRIKKVVFTPSFWAPLTENVEPAPRWLRDVRRATAGRISVPANTFTLGTAAIETACPNAPGHYRCGRRPSSYKEEK